MVGINTLQMIESISKFDGVVLWSGQSHLMIYYEHVDLF